MLRISRVPPLRTAGHGLRYLLPPAPKVQGALRPHTTFKLALAFAGWSWMAFAESRRVTKFGTKVSGNAHQLLLLTASFGQKCSNIDRLPLQTTATIRIRWLDSPSVLALDAAVIEFVHQRASSSPVAKCARGLPRNRRRRPATLTLLLLQGHSLARPVEREVLLSKQASDATSGSTLQRARHASEGSR